MRHCGTNVKFFLQDGNGKVSKSEYKEWYKKVVEVDSDFEDDFEVADDADFKKKYEEHEIQKKMNADFRDFDVDGDGNITMKELITKLNPSASNLEKEKLAVIVSSAPNFDLDGDGNINMREMIIKLNPSVQGNLLRGIVVLSYATTFYKQCFQSSKSSTTSLLTVFLSKLFNKLSQFQKRN